MGKPEWVEAIKLLRIEERSSPKRVGRCESNLDAVAEGRGEVVHVGGLILILRWILGLILEVALALAVVYGWIKEVHAVVILIWTLILLLMRRQKLTELILVLLILTLVPVVKLALAGVLVLVPYGCGYSEIMLNDGRRAIEMLSLVRDRI